MVPTSIARGRRFRAPRIAQRHPRTLPRSAETAPTALARVDVVLVPTMAAWPSGSELSVGSDRSRAPLSGFLSRLHPRPLSPLCSGDLPSRCCRERAFTTYRDNLGRFPNLCPTRALGCRDPRPSCLGQLSTAGSFHVCLAEGCERSGNAVKFLGQPILFLL